MKVRKRFMAVLVGVAVVATALAVVPAASADESSAVRRTTLGLVRGVDESRTSGTVSWRGIPYAEPPVGQLRWHAPVTHRAWRGVRDTSRFGNGCVQEGRMFSPAPSGPHYGLDVRDG